MSIADSGARLALVNMVWKFHGADEFEQFAAQWDAINQTGSGVPALTAVFVGSLLKEFGTGRERLAVGYLADTVQAMAVLRCEYGTFWETFQPAQAPLGAWVHRPPNTLESLVPGLIRDLPGFALAIGITQQDPELVRRPDDQGTAITLDYIQTSRVTVEGSFEAYWMARGKNLRTNMKRQRSRLEKDGTALRLDTVTNPADVAKAIEDYGRLESSGWKGAEGTAIHPDNAQGRFYRTLLEESSRRGAARIYRFWYGDSVVAVDLCIESENVLIVLKTTYDESIRDSSPASLMREEYFRNIFDEASIKRIEFYGKLMEWHTKWSEEKRTLYHANFYRWSWLAQIEDIAGVLRRKPASLVAPANGGKVHDPASVGRSHVVALHENLAELPDRYIPLFASVGRSSLFHTLPWYRNFLQTVLSPTERVRIYAVDSAAKPQSARAVLLMRCQAPGTGAFGPHTLSGLSNYYNSLFGPVLEPNQADEKNILDAFAAAIAGEDMRWDVVDMHPLAADQPLFAGLKTAFRNAGLLVQTYFCFGNWYLKVRGRSYAEYYETLPSPLKNTLKRKKKQFESSPRSRIVVYQDEARLDEGMRDYEKIYKASWKIPEPYPEFIRGLCRTSATAHWLRLGIAYVDDQPAAAQIWIVNGSIASIYKLAYDERFARLSLGSILTAHLMEHVIDMDKVQEVDYLTGDDAYKKDWMSDRRERWGIVAFNLRTPMGLLAAFRHLAGRAARSSLDMLHAPFRNRV